MSKENKEFLKKIDEIMKEDPYRWRSSCLAKIRTPEPEEGFKDRTVDDLFLEICKIWFAKNAGKTEPRSDKYIPRWKRVYEKAYRVKSKECDKFSDKVKKYEITSADDCSRLGAKINPKAKWNKSAKKWTYDE